VNSAFVKKKSLFIVTTLHAQFSDCVIIYVYILYTRILVLFVCFNSNYFQEFTEGFELHFFFLSHLPRVLLWLFFIVS